MVKFQWMLAALLAGGSLAAQEPVAINRLTEEVNFDGKPDEAAWNAASQFSLTMFSPTSGIDPTEKSEVFVGYDKGFLWVGARLYTRDAATISATSMKRDELSHSSDAFGIVLDTYDDNENALAFFTMPTGARIDYSIANDGVMVNTGGGFDPSSGPMNMSWNTFWDVKTTRDDKGWYVEMRIPFSSLRFDPVSDKVTMGMLINRTIAGANETDTWPVTDQKYGFMAATKPSLARNIELDGVKSTRPLYVAPYLTAGYTREYALNDAETQYERNDNPDYNAGIDVKYGITSNLTLDVTANTDFAQVEADNQQVNLTRYNLFFPEKRMFFQERASLFSFNLGGASNLFYSRNIGISDGTPVRIYGGARLIGKAGKWETGLIDMQTAEHDTLPGENFGVARLRRQVFNPNSYVGAIFTSRLGMNGDQNFAYGADGIFKLFGDDYLSVRLAQTYDSKTGNSLASMDPTFFLANWERRSEKGLAYNFAYSYSGSEFNPGIGFVQRPGLQGGDGRLMWGWIPGEDSKLMNVSVSMGGRAYTRLDNGNLENLSVGPGLEIWGKSGLGGMFNLNYQKEGVLFDFQLSDSVSIKAGNYAFTSFMGNIMTSMSKPVSAMLMINAGQFYDGNQLTLMLSPTVNFSSSLQLSGGYNFSHLSFPDRPSNNSLNIHSVNIRALYMMNTKLSASALVQFVNTSNDLIANFRIRYNPHEGNDFYLVYNEYRGVGMAGEIPAIPSYYNRTIMLKYTYTFRF